MKKIFSRFFFVISIELSNIFALCFFSILKIYSFGMWMKVDSKKMFVSLKGE